MELEKEFIDQMQYSGLASIKEEGASMYGYESSRSDSEPSNKVNLEIGYRKLYILEPFFDKEIKNIYCDRDKLTIEFEKGIVYITDNDYSCCESRYMHSDDNLASLIGNRFVDVFLKGDSTEYCEDDIEEVIENLFLEIKTDKDSAILTMYNSHNGYYGGFNPLIEVAINETI